MNLDEERDIMFAMTKVKLMTQIAEHESMIKTIYRKLTGATTCRNNGSHWVEIGFQASDPC